MKKLLPFAILMIFSGQINAYIISKVKESCVGFVSCGHETIAPRLEFKKKVMFADVMAHARFALGKVGQYSQIDGYHDVLIENETKREQAYEYFVSVECDENRYAFSYWINLKPGEQYRGSDHTYGVTQKKIAGYYPVTAKTELKGESSKSDYHGAILTISEK